MIVLHPYLPFARNRLHGGHSTAGDCGSRRHSHRSSCVNPRGRRSLGFTLVELLVVMGIISILIAMLLPALNKVRASAQTLSCLSNLRQVMMGLTMYAQDSKGKLPFAWTDNTEQAQATWSMLVARGHYLAGGQAFICPSRLADLKNSDLLNNFQVDLKTSSNPTIWAWVSYSASYGAMPYCGADPCWKHRSISLAQPGVPASQMLVLVEGAAPKQAVKYSGWYAGAAGMATDSFSLYTHPGRVANAAFLDGHCATLQSKSLGWNADTRQWAAPGAWTSEAPWYLGKFVK